MSFLIPVFIVNFGVGCLFGLIVGKVLTEREMVDYGDERYDAGYAQGIHDAETDPEGPDDDDEPQWAVGA